MQNNNSKLRTALLIMLVIMAGIIIWLLWSTSNIKSENPIASPSPTPITKTDDTIKNEVKQKPTAVTDKESNFYQPPQCDSSKGQACIAMITPPQITLNGHYDGHGLQTTTWFESWYFDGNDKIVEISKQESEKVVQKTFKGSASAIINLNLYKYAFRLVAQNTEGVTYGNIMYFYNPGKTKTITYNSTSFTYPSDYWIQKQNKVESRPGSGNYITTDYIVSSSYPAYPIVFSLSEPNAGANDPYNVYIIKKVGSVYFSVSKNAPDSVKSIFNFVVASAK